ncbi:response regulator [Scytonema sp. UIC 10036]|uniref:response regulator n=1 Tax=Scytonema sp. UIC 10036 TaxID=2304196 RepID=UPI0012DA2584|nr:response regulator [Scytonema sp. UIC 10036]MUG98469.1 response regulator [Scytonema sp. UIC 10036]
MKILIVEDDEATAAALTKALKSHNYIVTSVGEGSVGLQLAQNFEYDLVVLDVMLPKLDGFSLCRQLRSLNHQMPILLLTAKGTSADKVRGFNAGADDYVVKPFNLSELIARIRSLLRRANKDIVASVLAWEKLQLDTYKSTVTYDGRQLHLTAKEYQLLELFLRNPHRIFSRSAILEHLWSSPEYPGEDAVKTHIKGLRQKLKAGGITVDLIETVYGLGYRLKYPCGDEKPTFTPSSLKSTKTSRQQAEAKVVASLAQLWERFKDSFVDEVSLLLQAATALQLSVLETEERQKAQQVAHKLVGGLGSFGFTEGSRLAQQIEQLLQTTDIEPLQAQQLVETVKSLRQDLEKPLAVTTPALSCKVQQTLLLVIYDDVALIERIQMEATAWGFEVNTATSLAVAREAIASNTPDVILLDLTFIDPNESGLAFLAELREQNPEISVIVLTGKSSLTDRLDVARLGARAFIHKSVPCSEILKVTHQIITHTQPPEAKVMIVDDDPRVLSRVSALFHSWGLYVTAIAEPQQFWQVLESTIPDLLILDVKMPNINGIELCQVVRNDPRWCQLPIMFLSACSDIEIVQEVFTAGADDYVQKPIVEPELITRVFNRLKRTKILRELAESQLHAIPPKHPRDGFN